MMTLDIHEAAKHVGVSEATIRSWVIRGQLEPLRRGAKPLRFNLMSLAACKRDRMSQAEHERIDTLWADVLAQG